MNDLAQLKYPNSIPEGKLDNAVDPAHVQEYASKYSEAILLVPHKVQRSMLWVAGEHAQLDERQLEHRCAPNPKTKVLRVNFWNEYYAAIREGRKMSMMNVYRTVCTHVWFYTKLDRRESCVWMFRPTTDYNSFMEEQLHKGLQRIGEILALPIEVNGKVSTPTANLILKTVQMVENRVKGAVVQKHEHKNLNLSLSADSVMPKDLIELEKKIALLEASGGVPVGGDEEDEEAVLLPEPTPSVAE
jgi:hypothetical protein